MRVGLQQSHPHLSRMSRRALRAYEQGALADAERLYAALLRYDPENFDALHGLGKIHCQRGQLGSALVAVQAALRIDRGRADGFVSLGLIFYLLRRLKDALASYDEGLGLEPDSAELLNGRGVILLELGRPADALQSFERALVADPSRLDALGNYGNALVKLNRPAEALAAYDRALVVAPDNAQLLTNRAVALRRLDRPQEALMSARRALVSRPDFAQAKFVESVARLTLGDFGAGWRGYEARWRVGALASQRRSFVAPLWLGREPLDGKTILLHAEQGFGDTIQFVRYAPRLATYGARDIIVEVQPALRRLLRDMPGVTAVVAHGDRLPHFDVYCPLLSLPLAFSTELSTIPAEVPYVSPDDESVAVWRGRLPRRRPLIGLAWSGERSHDNDLNRSMRLQTMLPLLDLPDATFVSLQHDVREEDAATLQHHRRALHVTERFDDFADTAAVVACLDAVISVDSAVAHLAGAMGKPLFLLLPFAADFRWLRERQDSPWYPTARLYRQPSFGDWDSIVGKLRQDLMQAPVGGAVRKRSA